MARTQVQSELIATNAISGTIIADNAITATHIATNSISGTLVQDSGIVTSMIAANNVTAAKIVSDGVETRHLHSNVISGQSTVTAASGDFVLIGDTSDSDNLKKALVSDFGVSGISSSADATAITINSSEQVGIGVTDPDQALEIGAGGKLKLSRADNARSMLLFTDNNNATIQSDTDPILVESANYMAFNTNGANERIRIGTNGKVGIGTTSTDHQLSVNAADYDGIQLMQGGTDTGYISVYHDGSSTGRVYVGGLSTVDIQTGNGGATDGTTRMRIHASACVGIGSTVDRSIDTNVGTLVINGSAGGGLWLSDDDQSSTTSKIYSFTEGSVGKLRINQGSGVGGGGIDFCFNENYTAPNVRLTTVDTLFGKTSNDLDTAGAHIISAGTYAGSVYSGITSAVASSTYHVRDTTNNTWEFYVTNAGVINATSTSISSLSDVRLKENIKDLETGLDEVMALKPRRFDWKDREEKNVAGFIAQEVEPVLPDLIGDFMHDDLDDAKTVKMSDIIPTLVKAIQEQQEIIEELKANSHPCKELHEFDAYPDLIKRIEELENK